MCEPPQPHDFIELKFSNSHTFSNECIGLYLRDISLNEIALHQHGYQTGIKIAERVYTAWRKTGRTRAQPLFGFTYFMGQLIEEPREQQVLILIRRLAAEGKSAKEIAQYLNGKRLKPRRAKVWHPNSIAKILNR